MSNLNINTEDLAPEGMGGRVRSAPGARAEILTLSSHQLISFGGSHLQGMMPQYTFLKTLKRKRKKKHLMTDFSSSADISA